MWQLKGVRLQRRGDDPDFAETATAVLYRLGPQDRAERFVLDVVIHPGEKLRRNLLLRLPSGRFQAASFDLLNPP